MTENLTKNVLPSTVLAAGALALPLVGEASAAPVVFDTAGATLSVDGGEADSSLTQRGGYYRYFDKASGAELTYSVEPLLIFPDASLAPVRLTQSAAGGFGTPTLVGGAAQNLASVNGIDVTARTSLVDGFAVSTFDIASTTSLAGVTFVFYAENDVVTSTNTATFAGGTALDDVVLYQNGGSIGNLTTVVLQPGKTTNADLSLFGSGVFSGFGGSLEAGDVSVLSNDGSNFVFGPGDLGLALAWSLSGTNASLTVSYGSAAAVPEPASLSLLAGSTGLLLARRRRA